MMEWDLRTNYINGIRKSCWFAGAMRKAGLAGREIAFMQFAGKTGLFDECRGNRTMVWVRIW